VLLGVALVQLWRAGSAAQPVGPAARPPVAG
jgi:hypothetical protein